ncbi:cbb3-type cytochrome c oxidase subunit I [Leptolyngbya sp. 15MV]|nr:cbb3-type cytochrome c oxidase subunit I [Leptolyngbya sp. 15MV]
MANAYTSHHDDHHDHKPGFVARWFFSTNHKDIGTLYIGFAIIAAIIGVGLSLLMRIELQQPGLQIFADGQTWNAYVSAHGLIMVFFVVMPPNTLLYRTLRVDIPDLSRSFCSKLAIADFTDKEIERSSSSSGLKPSLMIPPSDRLAGGSSTIAVEIISLISGNSNMFSTNTCSKGDLVS